MKNNLHINENDIILKTKQAVFSIRNQNVILDSDLAHIYGVETKRLNENIKRNIEKFPIDFMFQLTKEEYANLKSQFSTSSWGGRRTLSYVFTEFGMLQAANMLRSKLANQVSIYVIRTFISLREANNQKNIIQLKTPENKLNFFNNKIQPLINNFMNTIIDKQNQTTLKQEAQDIIKESINSLKAKLRKSGLENEEILANITKTLAEAENIKEKTRTDNFEFISTIKKLSFLLKSQLLFDDENFNKTQINKINSFVEIIKEITLSQKNKDN